MFKYAYNYLKNNSFVRQTINPTSAIYKNQIQIPSAEYTIGTAAKYAMVASGWALMAKPDVMLSAIPLYNVQNLEIGYSSDILKYRATKGIYLAHQHDTNGKVACKLDIVLTEFPEIMLNILERLYIRGEETVERQPMNIKNFYKVNPASGAVTNFETPEDIERIKQDPHFKALQEEIKFRRTFTFLTSSEVLFNMYIQTFVYSRDPTYGKNVIKVSLFLRRYVPQPMYEYAAYYYDMGTSKDGVNNPKFNVKKPLIQKCDTTNIFPDNAEEIEFRFRMIHRMVSAVGTTYSETSTLMQNKTIRKTDAFGISDYLYDSLIGSRIGAGVIPQFVDV